MRSDTTRRSGRRGATLACQLKCEGTRGWCLQRPPHGVTAGEEGGATDFTNLGLLVAICNLSSLLPLLALGWLDEAPALPSEGEEEMKGVVVEVTGAPVPAANTTEVN